MQDTILVSDANTARMTTGQHTLPTGYRLHWYRVEAVLGQGGFGITYLATDINLGQKVAIKEYLPRDLAYRDDSYAVKPIEDGGRAETYIWGLERFLFEGRTLANFQHPNIVRVLTIFEENGTAYMVMEYEHGMTLEEAWQKGNVRDQASLFDLTVVLAKGLRRVHEAGFIHRDIKPDNIYIRDDAGPVLLDFGSARQHIGAKTKSLTALYTPGYTPFEQYNSDEHNDRQGPFSDIYSLAATVYRGVCGQSPVDAMWRANALLDEKEDPLRPLRELDIEGFDEKFVAAVDSALAFHARERPQTVDAWLDMFGEVPEESSSDWVPTISTTTEVPLPEIGPMGDLPDDPMPVLNVPAPDVVARGPVRRERSSWRWMLPLLMVAGLGAGVALGAWLVKPPPSADLATVEPSPPAAQPSTQIAETPQPPTAAVVPPLLTATPAVTGQTAPAPVPQLPVAENSPDGAPASVQANAAVQAPAASADSRVQALLALAEEHLGAYRLTTPAQSNATDNYHEVLRIQPDNTDAIKGLRRVVHRYVGLVENRVGEGDLTKAEVYARSALNVAPSIASIHEEAQALFDKVADLKEQAAGSVEAETPPTTGASVPFNPTVTTPNPEAESDRRTNEWLRRLPGA